MVLKPVIYLDLYVLLNFLVDYFLLFASGRLSSAVLCRRRILIASGIGSLYAAAALFYTPVVLTGYLVGTVMVLVGFGTAHIIRRTGLFFLLSCALQGIMMLVSERIRIHFSLFIFISGFFVWVLNRYIFRSVKAERTVLPAELSTDSCTIRLSVLLDTGNQLRDPISGRPVLIVEYQTLLPLLRPELAVLLTEESLFNPEQIFLKLGKFCPGKFMLLPYSSVGNPDGLLLAFRCDTFILEDTAPVHHIIVAFAPKSYGSEADFNALYGTE